MGISTFPYKISISFPESLDYILQRVQIETRETVWDVCWDSLNNQVICYDTQQNFYRICLDNLDSYQINMYTVLQALGCPYLESYSIYPMYLMDGTLEQELLGAPISSDILFQMEVR